MSKLRDLTLGTAKRKRFSFKRKTVNGEETHTVLIAILSERELDCARVAAAVYVDGIDEEKRAEYARDRLLETAYTVEVLAAALRDPDAPDEPWATADELRDEFGSVEIALLEKAYEEFQSQLSFDPAGMSLVQYEAALEAVAKAGDLDPLVLLAPSTRRAFHISTAKEAWNARQAKSSPGSASSEKSPRRKRTAKGGGSDGAAPSEVTDDAR